MLFMQFFDDHDKTLQFLVECTKLYPKAHVLYFGSMIGLLYVHHPDTVRVFCGSGNVCACVCAYA